MRSFVLMRLLKVGILTSHQVFMTYFYENAFVVVGGNVKLVTMTMSSRTCFYFILFLGEEQK